MSAGGSHLHAWDNFNARPFGSWHVASSSCHLDSSICTFNILSPAVHLEFRVYIHSPLQEKKKMLSPPLPVRRGASAWLAVMIQKGSEGWRQGGFALARGIPPGKAANACRWGWEHVPCCWVTLKYCVPLLCLIGSMSPLHVWKGFSKVLPPPVPPHPRCLTHADGWQK